MDTLKRNTFFKEEKDMANKKYSIKDEFTMITILTIPICVAVNVVGDQIVQLLKLPIFLDVIGTILVGMLAGPWAGAVTGILSNCVMGITDNPTLIPFAITSASIGLAAGFFSRKDWFEPKKVWKIIVAVIVMDLLTICTASPITIFAFGGVSGNGGQSVAIAGLMAAGSNIVSAVIGTDLWVNALDRAIGLVVAYAVIRVIPDRTLIKYALGDKYTKKKA